MLFALGRELLGNAARHAGASQVRLNLTRTGEAATLVVSDDGAGIPEGRLRQALLDGHIGLAAVRERVAALGGTLSIATAPGSGTSVRVTLPAGRTADAPEHSRTPSPVAQPEISDRVTPQATLRVSTG